MVTISGRTYGFGAVLVLIALILTIVFAALHGLPLELAAILLLIEIGILVP